MTKTVIKKLWAIFYFFKQTGLYRPVLKFTKKLSIFIYLKKNYSDGVKKITVK